MSAAVNAASVALFSGEKVLVIQRAFAPYKGYWTLPGGRLEPGEAPEDCARREVHEELGLHIGALTPVGLSPGGARFVLQVFAARMPAAVPRPSNEIAAWGWARPHSVEVEFRATPGLGALLERAAGLIAPPTDRLRRRPASGRRSE